MSDSSLWYRNSWSLSNLMSLRRIQMKYSHTEAYFWGLMLTSDSALFSFYCGLMHRSRRRWNCSSPARPEIFPASPKRSDSVKFVEFATQSAAPRRRGAAMIPEQKPPFTMRDTRSAFCTSHSRIVTTFQFSALSDSCAAVRLRERVSWYYSVATSEKCVLVIF